MDFIKKNKLTVFIVGCVVVCVIALLITFYFLFFKGSSNNKYGDRLDGIDQVSIEAEKIGDIENSIKSKSSVISVSHNLEGRLLNFTIEVSSSTKKATAKKLVSPISSKLSKDQLSFYDVQVFITCDNEKSKVYPIIGYKHKTSNKFIWTNN